VARPFLRRSDHERIFAKPLTRERLGLIASAGFARLLGRKHTCSICGQSLPKIFVFLSKGRLAVWGLQETPVVVEFADRASLRFRHAMPDQCKSYSKQ
jgi:hypothetical protein